MSGNKYRLSKRVESEAPDDYKKYLRDALLRQAGIDLLKILQENKLPAVVDVEERLEKRNMSAWVTNTPVDEYIIEIEVNPVRHKHITMPHVDDLYFEAFKPNTFWKRLKFLLGL